MGRTPVRWGKYNKFLPQVKLQFSIEINSPVYVSFKFTQFKVKRITKLFL